MSRGEPYAGATTPGRRPLGPMTWLGLVGVALGGITLAALFSGGDGRAEISAGLSECIPEIAGFFEISTMADLREFNEPSADLRARFSSSGEVYRVIDSSVDRARIVLWRIDVPGPEPGPYSSDPDRGFSTEELVVGTACASIERTGHTVTSTPVDCPHPLAAWSPPTEVASWTRDAAAAWVVQVSVSSLNQDIRWLLFHNSDGSQPRHELVDADAVVDVIKKARLSSANTSGRVTVEEVSQEGSRITGKVRIAASAPEEANTTAMSTIFLALTAPTRRVLMEQRQKGEATPRSPEPCGAPILITTSHNRMPEPWDSPLVMRHPGSKK